MISNNSLYIQYAALIESVRLAVLTRATTIGITMFTYICSNIKYERLARKQVSQSYVAIPLLYNVYHKICEDNNTQVFVYLQQGPYCNIEVLSCP